MHSCLFRVCGERSISAGRKAFSSHQHIGRAFRENQHTRFTDDIDTTHFPSRVNFPPWDLTNPELTDVVGVWALTKPSKVNRVVSTQATLIQLLILQLAPSLLTGIGDLCSPRSRPFEKALALG